MDDISTISEEVLRVGEQRIEIIAPLAKSNICSRKMVLDAASTLGLSTRYVYKLIHNYRQSHGLMTSIVPQKPNGGKGRSRLSTHQEELINQVIDEFYLTSQKLSSAKIIEEIRKQCFEKHISFPSEITIRRRLASLTLSQLQKRSDGSTSTEPIIGSFPKVDYPLDVVQIDHTLVDVIIVDPIERLPISRPYVTFAIDTYSRCIAGFVLSLEAPSATSVGLCLTHIAMDKAPWLQTLEIDASWPIHGKPNIIHVDNGSDFHSNALTRGCLQHGIKIQYRPMGKPHYGGIIERVIGTMMKLVHTLPGTTFSNIKEKGDYPSESKACLTLSELERWLIIAITKYYHLRLHTGIFQTPLKLYESGLLAMKQHGKNLSCISDKKAFLIDFLPIIYRSLRKDGFTLDHITYYSNALRPFIANRDKYGKFLIRRDPRDLSRIYVYLEEEKIYLDVSYRSLSHPAISLFEHRLALKALKIKGKEQVNESNLFRAIDEMRHIVKSASSKTRTMRKNRTRIQENAKAQPKTVIITKFDKPIIKENVEEDNIKAFDNIEMW
jgi:putative transposase